MESLQPPPSAVISVPSSPSVTSLQPQSTQSTTTICNIPPPAVNSMSSSPSVTSPQPQSTQFITTIRNTDRSSAGPTVTLSESHAGSIAHLESSVEELQRELFSLRRTVDRLSRSSHSSSYRHLYVLTPEYMVLLDRASMQTLIGSRVLHLICFGSTPRYSYKIKVPKSSVAHVLEHAGSNDIFVR